MDESIVVASLAVLPALFLTILYRPRRRKVVSTIPVLPVVFSQGATAPGT